MIGCLLAVVLAQSPAELKQISWVSGFVREARRYVQRRRSDAIFVFRERDRKWHRKRPHGDYRHRRMLLDEQYQDNGDGTALVFLRNSKVLLVIDSSGSEDSAWEAEYFYRPDGSLAYCEQDYGTVHEGGRGIERRTILDSAGRVLADNHFSERLDNHRKLRGQEAIAYVPFATQALGGIKNRLRPSSFEFMAMMPKGKRRG